jgi:hypothetical protein
VSSEERNNNNNNIQQQDNKATMPSRLQCKEYEEWNHHTRAQRLKKRSFRREHKLKRGEKEFLQKTYLNKDS